MTLRGRGFLLCSGHSCSRKCVTMTSACFLYLLAVRDFPERQGWVVLWLSEPRLGEDGSLHESKPGSVGVSNLNIIAKAENLGTFHSHSSDNIPFPCKQKHLAGAVVWGIVLKCNWNETVNRLARRGESMRRPA